MNRTWTSVTIEYQNELYAKIDRLERANAALRDEVRAAHIIFDHTAQRVIPHIPQEHHFPDRDQAHKAVFAFQAAPGGAAALMAVATLLGSASAA